MQSVKRYMVFAYKKDGLPGGYRDLSGFADNLGQIADLVGAAQLNALINPDVIEVYDSEQEELVELFAINSDGDWIRHELDN